MSAIDAINHPEPGQSRDDGGWLGENPLEFIRRISRNDF